MQLQRSPFYARRALYATALIALVNGCAASTPHSIVPKGDIDLSLAMPSPTPSPFGLSTGSQNAHAVAAANLDEYLLPQAPTHKARAASPMARKHVTAEPVVIAQPELVATAEVPLAAAVPVAAAPDTSSDAQLYQQREDKKLETYRGGDVIVIGASTLLIVLLIVLLILLLR